jgi:cold shock protein
MLQPIQPELNLYLCVGRRKLIIAKPLKFSTSAVRPHPLRECRLETKMAQPIGEVKWFNNAKGYGSVGRDGGPDVFCHSSSIIQDYKSLQEGEQVEFDVILVIEVLRPPM